MKKCWQCAEEIQSEALVCRFCNAEQTTEAQRKGPAKPAAAAAEPSKKSKTGMGCLVIIGLIATIAYCVPRDNRPAEPSAPPVTASAREIFNAYQANEVAAQERFGNRKVTISGEVAAIDADITDDPVVRLVTANQFMSMGLHLGDASKSRASSLSKGQEIIAICTNVREIAGTPYADECWLQ